jgi:RecJ-like exonuclease
MRFFPHNTFVFNLIADIEKREDCGQSGHKNKGSYKCSLYVSSKYAFQKIQCNVIQNDIEKRKIGSKDDVRTNIEKGKGKKQRLEEASSSKSNDQAQICKSCGQTGHKSARSKECSNYKATLDEALKIGLGDNYERFTRKVYLEAIIRPEYKESFTEKIIK